jgi:hypothetical protein
MGAENEDEFGYGKIPTATLTFLAHLTESVVVCSISTEQAIQELRAIRRSFGRERGRMSQRHHLYEVLPLKEINNSTDMSTPLFRKISQ